MSNLLKSFLGRLRREASVDADGRRYLRIVFTVASVFFIVSLLAVARIGWALQRGAVWVNYRGAALSRGQLYTAMALSAFVALASLGIVMLVRSSLRRPE